MTLWSNRLCWEHVCQMWEAPSRMLEECSTRWAQYRFGLLDHDALRIICPPWQWNRSSCTFWENAWRCRVGISPLTLQEQQKPKNPYFKIHNFVSQMGFWRWAFCCQMQNRVQQTKTHFQNPSWVFCGMILYPRWVLKVDFWPNTKSCATKNPSSKSILGFCCIILYPRWILKRGFLLCTIFYFALLKMGFCIFWVLIRLLVIPTAVLFSQQLLGCSLRLGLTSFAHGMG